MLTIIWFVQTRSTDLLLLKLLLIFDFVFITWGIKDTAREVIASSSEAEEEREEHPKQDGEKDPDFSKVIRL